MLRGSALARVDEKGRLKLPQSFRSLIEPKYGKEFFVTSLDGVSVRIYPLDVWNRIEERVARAPQFDPSIIRFKNTVNFFGQSVAMDPQGRILIQPLLRERAEMRGEVTVIGQQDHLEVWNRTLFEEHSPSNLLSGDDYPALARFGI